KYNLSEVLMSSFQRTVEDMTIHLGNDIRQWKWSRMHRLEIEHPIGRNKPFNLLFNVGPSEIDGGDETLNNQGFETFDDRIQLKVNLGAAMRRIVDFANPESGFAIIPSGQSGNFMSPHYDDQFELYVKGTYREEFMGRIDVLKASRNNLIFIPE
ncbi:MAG: penicillin acylase family protein, partial [Bacteroidetes bacterium]